nr:tetratricopeptide repeat protein [Thiomicrorhabdus cannonii]
MGETAQESGEVQTLTGLSKESVKDQPVVKHTAKTSNYVSPARVARPTVKREEVRLSIQAREEVSALQQAYDAMQLNDLEKAQVLFERILSENPSSVNALNGMASIYAQRGDPQQAIKYYYQALEKDADNLYAYESVIQLTADQLSGEAWKDELKKSISKHPKSAVLHYALGNIYAKENDWNMAQAQFFEAHSLSQDNPDYLVNLAISLDHLGEYALASEYYTSALVFAASRPVNFDESSIKARLANIKLFLEQNHI